MKKLLTLFLALGFISWLGTQSVSAQCRTDYTNYGALNPPSNSWQSANLSAGSPALLTFFGNKGDSWNFNTCYANGNPYFRLYDANWNLVVEVDNSATCEYDDFSLGFNVPNTGYYYVLVTESYCEPLSYGITLNYLKTFNDSYCETTRNNGVLYISKVLFNTINNASGNESYSRFTDQSTILVAGSDYNLSLNVSYDQTSWVTAWIDFNNDGDFNDAGEKLLEQNTYTLTPSFNVSIPRDAPQGNHRMRIRYTFASYSRSSCGNSYYGEVEDYTVNVLQAPIVSDISLDVLNSPCVSGQKPFVISLENNTGADQTNFEVYATITSPSGVVSDTTYSYSKILANGAPDVIADKFVFSEYGTYTVQLSDNIVGNTITKTVKNNGYFPHPYYMDNEANFTSSDYWTNGSQFGRGNNNIAGYIWDKDSIYSPVFSIAKATQYFQYYINKDNLYTGDTVYVQVRQDCGSFSTLDKVVVADAGKYNMFVNTNTGFDLTPYVGKKIQFRFYVVAKSGNYPYVNLEYLNVFPGYDFNAGDILVDKFAYNTNSKYRVGAVVRNNGARTQKDIVVELQVYGDTSMVKTVSLSEPTQFGNTDTAYFEIDATLSGKYEFITVVKAPIDDDASNNTNSANITLDDVQALPVSLTDDFNYNDDPAGVTPNDRVHFYFDNMYSSGNGLSTYNVDRDSKASATSFVFGPMEANAFMSFEFDVYSYDNGWNYGNKLGSKDIIRLQVSEDYGKTFSTVTYVDAANYNEKLDWQVFPEASLGNKAGKNLVFRILVENGKDDDQTQRLYVQVRNVYIGHAELMPVAITSNVDPACGNSAAYFEVQVNNNTPVSAAASKVRLEVTGEFFNDTVVEVSVASMAAYEHKMVKIGPFNVSESDNYQLNATVLYDYDYVASNDQFNRSFAVIPPKSSPYVENFDNGTFNPDDYSFKKAYYTYYDLSTDRVWYGDTSSFTTMKIGPINSGEFLVFEYLSQAFDNSSWSRLGTYMRAGDVASVYISSNCGATWQKVKDITSHANTNDPNQFPFESVGKIDLSAYANKTIRVKIEFVKGNPEGSAIFSVDNLQVIGSGDARVSALAMPQYVNGVAVCGAVNDEVVVEIENTGINTLTKVPVMVQRVYGQDTTVVMATYTGSIAPGMTDTITVAGFNTTEFGDYEIIAATMLEGDLNPDNDMYDAWLTVQSLSTVPYTYDGSWKPSVWQYFTDNGNSWNANVDVNNDMYWDSYLATPYMDDDDTAFVTMQKLGPIRADYKLRFSYNVFAFDDDQQFLSNYFRNGDKMEVQVSSNCGASYTTIFTADPSNYVNSAMDTMIVLGLDKFIDKDISVRFVVVKGSEIGKIRVGFNQIDVTIPAADLVLNQIYVDNQVCGKAEEGVYAVVTNASPFETLTGFNVSAVVTVANVVMEEFSSVYAGELLPGVTDTMFLGYFNSEMPNDYLVEASLQFEEDVDNSSNMASVYFTIHAPVQVPYFNNFSYDASNWLFKENSWFDGWSRLRTSSLNPGDTALFYSPKFEAITASSQMEFDFAKSNEFAIGDKLEVFVSDNCGSAWTLVNTVANDDNLSNFSVDRQITSLSAFAGKDIIVKFVFTNKNGSWYQATIDNFAINQSDVAVIGIVNETHKFDINQFNPNNGSTNFAERYITCGSANDSIFVVVENKGATSVSNFAVKLDVTGKAESSFTQTFNGTLEPGAKGWMYVGSVNSGTPGLLDMRASVALANDGNTANDTLGFSVTTQSTYEMPYSAFNSNEFNQNYYWKYDNNGFMNNSGNYLYSTLSRDQVGYAVSPKVRAEASSWLYFNYYVSNTLNEGHIIHDESLQVFVISNCSGNATEVWSMDVTSTDNTRNGTIALDLSAYAGADVQIMFKASKGNSDGGLYSEFTNIQLKEAGPISAVFESGDELFMNTNGAELCEGAGYSLNLLEFPVATMTYEWTFIGADTTYVVSDNYSYNDNIENYNNGTFTLTAWYTTNPSNKYTQSVDVAVRSLPTLPVISGDVTVLSNVGTSNYTLTGSNADDYIWTISNGGQISGDKSAVVFWNEGYLGTSVIYAQGRNVCGYGEEGELLVRVDYLNPTPGGNVADTKEGDANGMINNPGLEISTYPNPSDGNFAVTLPDGVSEGTLVIKNNLGYVVSQETVLTNKHDVQLLNLPSGVYYITFVSADKVFTKSIVIK